MFSLNSVDDTGNQNRDISEPKEVQNSVENVVNEKRSENFPMEIKNIKAINLVVDLNCESSIWIKESEEERKDGTKNTTN